MWMEGSSCARSRLLEPWMFPFSPAAGRPFRHPVQSHDETRGGRPLSLAAKDGHRRWAAA